MNIIIRKGTEHDLKQLQDLDYELFKSDQTSDPLLNMDWPYKEGIEYFKERCTKEDAICFVAEIENVIVGFLSGEVSETHSWRPVKRTELEMIFIKEEFRQHGIGTKLVTSFLEWSKTKGAEKVFVSSYADNKDAIKFYQSKNFKPFGCDFEITL